ncbi:MAG: hypothetical protein QGD94_04355, partial [Planctomycetia bacterium]|nr:hypothetical protein [Planctomycetia bacterium]
MTRDALRWITAGITLVQIVLLGATAPPALAQEPAAEDAAKVQFSGKQIHTWVPKPGMRIFLVVDSFVISWGKQKVASRDGVLWFDEARAKATGELVLGVYAEGNVVIVLADGDIVRRNIAYITIRSPGELVIDTDEDLRGSAAGSELFARANKTRQANVPAAEKDVVEVAVEVKPVAPTVKIIPQDDKRKVTFSSEVIGGERVSTWTGGVYVLRGDMELGADSIVIWAQDKPIDKAKPGAKPAKEKDEGEGEDKGDAGAAAAEGAPAQQTAAEAYLEGHVTIRLGDRTIYASRVFYDFRLDRAIILDGKIKTFDHNRGIPIYYYAKKIRQVARGAFQADDARLTTCEFGHPHYDLGARRIIMIDMTDKPLAPKRLQHVVFSAKGPTTRVRGVPVMWWPRVSGEIEAATSALRSARISNSSHRGTGLETEWNLFRVLGLERRPPGYDLFLELDAWSERGPAIGIKGKYERELYYGNIETYFIHDSGEDRLGGGADMKPPRETRGRIRWQHRKYFEEPWQNWELTLEFTHLSDVNFLNEFFEREFKEDKTQETVLYLKRQVDNKVVTILVKPRVVDFLTVTEYYPRVDYMIIGRSLLNNRLTYFTHNELAVMRYLPNKNLGLKNSPATFVGDTKHELDWPLAWGPVKIVPYAEVRGTYFSDTMAGGEEGRAFGTAGIRLATQLWKTFEDVESEFWNVHRLRHVNTFEAYFFTAGSSVPSRDL